MLESANYASRLKHAREALGLEWTDVPVLSRVNASAYLDLESHDNEISIGISADEVTRILACLKLSPLDFFPATPTASETVASYAELGRLLGTYLARTGQTPEVFGHRVGWDVREPILNPARFGDLPLDALSDICEPLRVDWRGLLKQ